MRLLKRATLLAAALATMSSVSFADDDFKLSEKLSVSGFVDMSYNYIKAKNTPAKKTGQLDQAEIDFKYDFSKAMTAQVDLEAQAGAPGTGGGYTTDIEQAFFNYEIGSGFSVKAGRFLSYSGWEAEEPTGLFQYSGTGYAKYFYGYYQDGLSAKYSNDFVDVAISAVDDTFNGGTNPALGSGNMNDMGYEFMLGVHPVKDWTIKGFYMSQEYPTVTESKYNIWTSYVIGGLTLAAEYNDAEDLGGTTGKDGTGYLFMANYAWEKFVLTLRYHDWEIENAAGKTTEEMSGFTFSPSYKVNKNLLLVTEYRMDDDHTAANVNVNTYSFEALVTF